MIAFIQKVAEMKAEAEIVALVKKLGGRERRLLVQFARTLESKPTASAAHRTKFAWAGWAGSFTSDDVSEMEKAIEDCERVDEAGWR